VEVHQLSQPISVEYDASGVTLRVEGEPERTVLWKDIQLIAISIEDEFLPFPYWYVGNRDALLRIPNDAQGSRELFFQGFVAHVPGYDSDSAYRTIIEASGAMEGSFIVWRSADLAGA
jgi:hypothetical protein